MCGAGGSGGYFQFETQTIWGKHYIAYAANQFDIYVDGYTPLRLRNSGGTALQIQANGLNVTIGGTLTQNSDERIKTDIANLPHSQCQQVFDAVDTRQYRRTDYETNKIRCGFIAQEVKAILPESMQNIVAPYMHKPSDREEEEEYLGIDYARLASVVLWGVCKNQQAQLAALTARVVALEAKKTKKTV
jgi:hypothetical protein